MKNWNYIDGAKSVKIGNEKAENTWTLQDAKRNYEAAKKEFEKNGDMFSKRKLDEVKSIIDKEYYAAYKRLEELERKRNDNMHNKGGSGEIPYYNEAKQNYAHWGLLRETIGNDTPAEYAKRPPKIVGGNSLPEELEKDVHKKDEEKVEEVKKLEKTGNKNVEAFPVKDGMVNLINTESEGGWVVRHQTKSGSIIESKRFEDDYSAAKQYAQHLVSKVGNTDPILKGHTESELKNVVYTVRSDKASEKKFKSRSEAAKYADSLVEQGHFGVHTQKEFELGSMRYAIDVNLRAPAAIDNKKTGNSNLTTSVEKGKLGLWNWYVHKDGAIVAGGTSATEIEAKSAAEKALKREKVGNSKTFYIIAPNGEKVEAIDYDQWHYKCLDTGELVEKRFSKLVGNSAYDDDAKKGKEDKNKGKLITAAGFEYHAPGYSSLSFKEKEEYKKGYYSTNDLKKEDIYKWGNSASDDKFAYVMREFDEGKLKTPDGKVVTDPAQAKAIAYSESKKTENGLKRAFNAMSKNKKVGNSTRVVDQETIGGIRTYVFYDDSDDVYYVSDKGQGPLGNIFDNPSFKTKDEAKRYIKQRIS